MNEPLGFTEAADEEMLCTAKVSRGETGTGPASNQRFAQLHSQFM